MEKKVEVSFYTLLLILFYSLCFFGSSILFEDIFRTNNGYLVSWALPINACHPSTMLLIGLFSIPYSLFYIPIYSYLVAVRMSKMRDIAYDYRLFSFRKSLFINLTIGFFLSLILTVYSFEIVGDHAV